MAFEKDFISKLDVALGKVSAPDQGPERFALSPAVVASYTDFRNAWVATASGRGDGSNDEGSPKGLMGLFGKILSNDVVSQSLNYLDMPRGAVTSLLKESHDLGAGDGFSLSDLYRQTVDPEERIGAGDHVDTGNYWLDVALGFAGDVAADPLTYLSFGTAGVVKRGSSGLMNLAAEAGERGILAKIAREGYTRLDDVEWQKLSTFAGEDLRGGTRIAIGRTRVGQKVARALTFGNKDAVSLKLLPDFIGTRTPRALALRGWQRTRAAAIGRKIFNGKVLSGDRSAARQMLRSASEDEVYEGFMFMRGTNYGRQLKRRLVDELDTEYDGLRRARQADGVDGTTAALALDGNEAAIATMGNHYTRLKEFVDGLPARMNEAAGRQWLTRREQYMPTKITDEFRDFLRSEGKNVGGETPFSKQSFEQHATIRAPEGDEESFFMGERIYAQGDPLAEGKGLKEQAWEIFVAREADSKGSAIRWFEQDLDVSMGAYTTRLANRTAEQHTLKLLEDYGIAQSLFDVRPNILLPEDKRSVLSAWHAISETRRSMKAAQRQLADVEAREAANVGLQDEAARRIGDVGTNPDAQQAAETSVRAFAAGAAARQARLQASDAYQGRLESMATKLNELEGSLTQAHKAYDEGLIQRGELIAKMADIKAKITMELTDGAVARQLRTNRNAPGPARGGTALPHISKRAHDLEAELSGVEDEILDLQARMDDFGETPIRMVDDIKVRDDVVTRAEKHLELLDELDSIEARRLADDATDVDNWRRIQINQELANNNSARVLNDTDVGAAVGVGVEGGVTREAVQRVAEVAREEARLMRSWIAATSRDAPFGFNATRAHGAQARALLGLDDRLLTLSDVQRKLADELSQLQRSGGTEPSSTFFLSHNLPEVDPDGYLQLRGPDGNITNVWWAGGAEPLDFSTGLPTPTSGSVDGFLGTRVSHNPRQAVGFADESSTLSPLAVASQNPRVFATEEIVSPFGSAADRSFDTRGGFGSGRGAALTEIQNETFLAGWQGADAVLSPQKLAQAARNNATMKAAEGYAQVRRWKQLRDKLATVDMNDRGSVAAAFHESFGDLFRGSMGRRVDTLSRDNWVMNRVVDDAFGDMGFATARHKADAADAFKRQLQGDGYDGILYNTRDGNWNAIAMDHNQIESARYVEVDDLPANIVIGGNANEIQFARSARDMAVESAQRTIDSGTAVSRQMNQMFGNDILRHTNADVRARRALSEEIDSQLGALRTEFAATKKARRNAAARASRRENRILEHARRLSDDAERLRGQHAKLTEDWAKGVIDEATMLERDGLMAKARVAELEALATVQEKALHDAYGGRDVLAARLGKLTEPEGEKLVRHIMKDGYKKVSEDLAVPEWALDALRDQNRMMTPGRDSPMYDVVRTFDWLTSSFKSWAVASPGFHARNLFGGLFNNSLANVSMRNYKRFFPAYQEYFNVMRGNTGLRGRLRGAVGAAEDPQTAALALQRAVRKLKTPQEQRAFAEVVNMGLTTHGQFTEIHLTSRGQGNLNPFSPSNRLVQANRRVGVGVENFLRGSMAFDRVLKGVVDAERTGNDALLEVARSSAIDDIIKYHFDYDDLSALEAGVARRLIPFYTWTRKNFPLQVEMLLTQPQKYTRYLKLKQNLEVSEEEGQAIPSYIQNQLNIKLPFSHNGDDIYWIPDLPFRELTRTIDPKRGIAASSNPILRAPLEAFVMDKKFFTDAKVNYGFQPVPQPMQEFLNIPPVGKALQAIGIVDYDDQGHALMDTRYQHVVADAIPLWGRFRRLTPSDDYYGDQAAESWANFLFGAGLHQNTEADRARALREG